MRCMLKKHSHGTEQEVIVKQGNRNPLLYKNVDLDELKKVIWQVEKYN